MEGERCFPIFQHPEPVSVFTPFFIPPQNHPQPPPTTPNHAHNPPPPLPPPPPTTPLHKQLASPPISPTQPHSASAPPSISLSRARRRWGRPGWTWRTGTWRCCTASSGRPPTQAHEGLGGRGWDLAGGKHPQGFEGTGGGCRTWEAFLPRGFGETWVTLASRVLVLFSCPKLQKENQDPRNREDATGLCRVENIVSRLYTAYFYSKIVQYVQQSNNSALVLLSRVTQI